MTRSPGVLTSWPIKAILSEYRVRPKMSILAKPRQCRPSFRVALIEAQRKPGRWRVLASWRENPPARPPAPWRGYVVARAAERRSNRTIGHGMANGGRSIGEPRPTA